LSTKDFVQYLVCTIQVGFRLIDLEFMAAMRVQVYSIHGRAVKEEGMIKNTKIAEHMSLDEVRMRMQMTSGFLKMQKWLVIYNAIVDPRPVPEIARHTGLSEASVYRIIDEYNKLGAAAIDMRTNVVDQIWYESPQGI